MKLPAIVPSTELSAEDYHRHPSLSCSQLKLLGPQYQPVDFWRQSWMNPHKEEENTDSIAKKFGRAAHMLLLEGEEVFTKNWSIKKGVGSTKEDGKLGEEEHAMLLGIRDAVLGDRVAGAIIPGCQSEVSMIADLHVERADGSSFTVPVRCRHDLYKPSYSADVKFMEEVTSESVAKAIANYGYDLQASWYPRIMGLCQPERQHQNFITIFIEKRKRNPKVLCVTYPDDVLAVAERRINERLVRFNSLMTELGDTQEWPGFESRIHDVFMPGTGDGTGPELPNYWNYLQ